MTTHDDPTTYDPAPIPDRPRPPAQSPPPTQSPPPASPVDRLGVGGGDWLRSPEPPAPSPFETARFKAMRLGFEAFLIALAAYLIGIAGLPPLFDAPGSDQMEPIASLSTDDVAEPAATATGGSDGAEAAVTGEALPGAGVDVTIGRATWSTSYFQAALFKALLEELGYRVTEPSANEIGPVEMYQTMAGGTVDFWSSTWMPNHTAFLDETTPDGPAVNTRVAQVGNLLPAGGLEGLVITRSVVEDNQIGSLDQINGDPDLVALFDSDGNGKAEINGCAVDWGCRKIIDEMLVFNGWENLEQLAPEDYDDAIDGLVERVDSGQPTMLYTWSPSGYLTRLRPGDNVLWLDMGGQDKLLDGSITPDYDFDELEPAPLGPACTSDPCHLGWAAADIVVTANNEFLDANPAARVLFEQVELKVLDVALANVKYDTGEDTEADLARHAQEWIAENRATVDAWLEVARAAS
ncbi:MAG: glycine betaine/L-proline ABC transporter substrate-binding protein ProX [Actinomycetota bacterium]